MSVVSNHYPQITPMKTLKQFLEAIDPFIRQRGMDYYRKGAVGDILRQGNRLHTTVLGTYPYQVTMLLFRKSILETGCSCPYERGPVCKHVVAVIHHLREWGIPDKSEIQDAVVIDDGTPSPGTGRERVREVIAKRGDLARNLTELLPPEDSSTPSEVEISILDAIIEVLPRTMDQSYTEEIEWLELETVIMRAYGIIGAYLERELIPEHWRRRWYERYIVQFDKRMWSTSEQTQW